MQSPVAIAIAIIFNRAWYLARYPDVAAAGIDPFQHYLIHGAAEGRDPNPLFNSAYYRSQKPNLEITPLEHYATTGAAEGCMPNPLFDSQWYLEENEDVAAASANPLAHYLQAGAKEGRDPHPLFSSAWFDGQNPGLPGANPLARYLHWGARHGLSPHPLFDPVWYLSQGPAFEAGEVAPLDHYRALGAGNGCDPHPLFDAEFYLSRNPDVGASGLSPLEHYLRAPASAGRDPHPLFSTSWYLKQNDAVAGSGVNALTHYVTTGASQGRSPHPLFDVEFYLEQLRDPKIARVAPLQHYLSVGWKRGTKPNSNFDPAFYLGAYQDVRDAGLEPLTHYALIGRAQGRLTLPDGLALRARSEESRAAAVDIVTRNGNNVSDANQTHLEGTGPAPPVQEAIAIAPLPSFVKLAVSVLFYHREDLAPSFLRALFPQLRAISDPGDIAAELHLTFNYQPSSALTAAVRQLIGEFFPDSPEQVHLNENGFNLGFGAGHNAVFKNAKSDVFVMLNSDVRIGETHWLRMIVNEFRSSDAALIGLETTASRLRSDACGIPVEGDQEFDFVDGSVLAVRSELARQYGLFSPAFDYFYFEDADLSLRYRQLGLIIKRISLPQEHKRSSSSRVLPQFAVEKVLNRNRARFMARWGNYLRTRELPNRIGVRFLHATRATQCASLPALLAVLSEHPGAVLDLAGVHEQLVPLFNHARIRLIPSWQTLRLRDYSRYHDVEESSSGKESRPYEVARHFGCQPNFSAARAHLEALVPGDHEVRRATARSALIYISRLNPLFAGRQPAPENLIALESVLSRRGWSTEFWTDLGSFEVDRIAALHSAEPHLAGLATGSEILRQVAAVELVISADHWIAEVSQLLGKKTFLWLGADSPIRALWRWDDAGFYHDRSLPCLGCYHRFGAPGRNICLRGDVACMRSALTGEATAALEAFLDGAPVRAKDLEAARGRTTELPSLPSAELSLHFWPQSAAGSVLVLMPTRPNLEQATVNRAIELARRATAGMRDCRLVQDDTGTAPLRGLPHPLRLAGMAAIRQGMIDRHLRDEQWVFWVDVDIVDYPESLIDELIARAAGGIAAPLVLMEGDASEPISNPFGFGPGRFYDIAGFVENGRWARFTQPYFDQFGPVYQLESVGSCYLVNADLYRNGAQHSVDPAARALHDSGMPWPEDAIARNQAGAADCFTEHYSVCAFARQAGLPVQAFADLIAYHERA